MIDNFNEYRCVIPCYKKGRFYNVGDIMRLPAGTEYVGDLFVLEKAAELEEKPKKAVKKKSPEVKG